MKIFADKHSWHTVDRRALLAVLDKIGSIQLPCVFELESGFVHVKNTDYSALMSVRGMNILINNGDESVGVMTNKFKDTAEMMFSDQGDDSILEVSFMTDVNNYFMAAIEVGKLKLGWRGETFADLQELIDSSKEAE